MDANFNILADILSDNDKILQTITQALLFYTGDIRSYNNVVNMSLPDIDQLHYINESLETHIKLPPYTPAEQNLFTDGKPVME